MDAEVSHEDGLTVVVTRNDERSRYEGHVGEDLVGVINFSVSEQMMIITHTGTEPAWRERGIAARLTTAALDDVRAQGMSVNPVCPYTGQFIVQHAEYADLLTHD